MTDSHLLSVWGLKTENLFCVSRFGNCSDRGHQGPVNGKSLEVCFLMNCPKMVRWREIPRKKFFHTIFGKCCDKLCAEIWSQNSTKISRLTFDLDLPVMFYPIYKGVVVAEMKILVIGKLPPRLVVFGHWSNPAGPLRNHDLAWL
jgi:hypothetical protein